MLIELVRNGRRQNVHPKVGELLVKKGIARVVYMTRDMQAAPVESVAPAADNLDAMDREQLHALAKARGVKVHHLAGADKVRAAIREAQ